MSHNGKKIKRGRNQDNKLIDHHLLIRPDQLEWLKAESLRRSEAQGYKGNILVGEIIREAIDLVIRTSKKCNICGEYHISGKPYNHFYIDDVLFTKASTNPDTHPELSIEPIG